MTLAAIIPAKDEAQRIAATVRAVRDLGAEVVVIDDGSSDDTARLAREAGARVVQHRRNRGKAAALMTGLAQVGAVDLVLFVDADLGESASAVGVLVPPVAEGQADMTIAVLPPQGPGGGHGFVVRLARNGIRRLTGWEATQPLSGMRCLNQAALQAGSPLAAGWGVEVGLTVDVLQAGLRVREVPCELRHRVTGSDWRGQLHRAAQYRDVARALGVRRWRAFRAAS
ncbi:glycosyl transferase family 2 [Branchiibius hedensis]|uniref:Glucosyl-3-phosphoglycerate synthase n=1 Tax=Branchiibius hedensis TaxID=672460 RepID=A0A2Y8ZUF7_9MICO|nr:glycosyltransferase family 2 protein [Branchiibius hedensis]PWJ27239.1 glycosyl transferase family 2 [Branchiibius hedensis]SSA36050.1 Glycosyl transferase family 2 [Branchiibius hedensis]